MMMIQSAPIRPAALPLEATRPALTKLVAVATLATPTAMLDLTRGASEEVPAHS
jgi:hypothetical protein